VVASTGLSPLRSAVPCFALASYLTLNPIPVAAFLPTDRTQGSKSVNGEGPGMIDLWDGHKPSNKSGTYSAFLYADRAVAVIEDFAASLDPLTQQPKVSGGADKLFMYIAWHNTQ
jgi:hypothetical protein